MNVRRAPELDGRPRRRLMARVRREQPNCWLCGLPIDLSLNAMTDPMGSTIDEVVPRSRSADKKRAALTYSNLRHAHRLCNSERGADMVTEERSSRDW